MEERINKKRRHKTNLKKNDLENNNLRNNNRRLQRIVEKAILADRRSRDPNLDEERRKMYANELETLLHKSEVLIS